MECDRCGNTTSSFITSMFNTDTICHNCLEIERQHPMYEKARETELEAVRTGDYNFKGIGLPLDLAKKEGSTG